MKYILNLKFITLLYFILILLIVNFNLLYIEPINNFISKTFTLDDIKNLSLANIGIFASLTGFLIASIPFLVSIIVNEEYLINAVNNNLTIITFTLKVIFFLFILSIITLFINFETLTFNFKIIFLSLFFYIYSILLYAIYEIIRMLNVFVSDLRELKKNMK